MPTSIFDNRNMVEIFNEASGKIKRYTWNLQYDQSNKCSFNTYFVNLVGSERYNHKGTQPPQRLSNVL